MTPISPSTRNTSLELTRSSTDGPIKMPARISPTTAGMLSRSMSSAATFAATSTIKMSSSASVTVIGLSGDMRVAGTLRRRPPCRTNGVGT